MSKPFGMVVAATEKWGIGKDNNLPWRLKGDMQYFKKLTSTTSSDGGKNAVIMGRVTWQSIPKKFRPLAGRVNYILTRKPIAVSDSVDESCTDVHVMASLGAAVEHASSNATVENIFIIGGASVYAQSMKLSMCTSVYLTKVLHEFECDTFMPDIADDGFTIDASYTKRVEEGDVVYEYQKYDRA